MHGQRNGRPGIRAGWVWVTSGALAAGGLLLGGCGGNPFNPNQPFQEITVRVTNPGNGNGRVLAPDPNVAIDCQFTAGGAVPAPCTDDFFDAGAGGTFTLEATPDSLSSFSGWSGCSSVIGTTCTLTFQSGLDVAFAVQARFDLANGFGVNRLFNPDFALPVAVGGLPALTGGWRGDSAYAVFQDQGIFARSTQMLRFMRSGLQPGAGFVSSQQWQLVDISSLASEVDAGKVRVDGSVWFNRVVGTAATDTRFDIRVLGYSGTPDSFPVAYNTPASVVAGTVLTTGDSWQQVSVADTLPAGVRYLAVEIYAFEDVTDDATDPEFDGHYADDASLVLTLLP